MVIIGVLLMILLFGGMGGAVFYAMRKSDPNRQDTSANDDITTAQEFLPFEDIRDGMINLGGQKYRGVIECSSINYNLRTEKEKEVIEISFQRFINSLRFPITFYIQTKIMDETKMINQLQEELQKSVQQYPHLQEYANEYLNDMVNLPERIGNNKQKKKYIIVPFEDAVDLPDLSDEEKYEYSVKELYNRQVLIADGMASMDIKAKILDTPELAELVYSTYHKDNYSNVEQVLNGEFLSLVVEGEAPKIQSLGVDAQLDLLLYEAQTKIKNELIHDSTPDFIAKNCEDVIQRLDKLRDELAGYYKSVNKEDSLEQQEFPLNSRSKTQNSSQTVKNEEADNLV